MVKPTVFLDIDHTILDMDAYKDEISKIVDANYGAGSNQKLWKAYADVREEKGYVDVEEIGMRFAKIMNSPDFASAAGAFLQPDPSKFLYKDANELLDYLADRSRLVIFSHGHELFQGFKVRKLGLDKKAEKVIITSNVKHEEVTEEMFSGFEGPIVVIEDIEEVLEKVKQIKPDSVVILAKYKRSVREGKNINFDLEAKSIREIIDFLKSRF